MRTHGYAVQVYQEDDGTWAAEVPDLPGCVAAGETPELLFEMLEDAIEGWIESATADGEAIPEPSREPEYSGRFLVRIGRSLHRQLAHRAQADGTSLNLYVTSALAAAVAGPPDSVAGLPVRPAGVSWWEVGGEWSIASAGDVLRYGAVAADIEPRRPSTNVINRIDVDAPVSIC